MYKALYNVPDIYLLFILCVLTIIVSIVAIYFIRKHIPIDLRYRDNAMLANMSGLISIIYGVLVGLTALYLITNISTTSEAVQREANATADFYRDTKWLTDPPRSQIQQSIKDYIQLVVNVEWPQMRSGEITDREGNEIIESISDKVRGYAITGQSDLLILQDMLQDIKTLYDARQQRIQMSNYALNPAIWAVVMIGTILMIGICCFYSMNFYLHIVTTCAVSIMASSMIYLLISLDRPFQGEFSIEPTPFANVIKQIGNG